MYEKREIEEMLKMHLKREAQLEELEYKIQKNRIKLQYDGKKMKMSDSEAIESMTFRAMNYSNIPSGKTNKKNAPVEQIALNYKDNLVYDNKMSYNQKIELINEIAEWEKKAEPLRDYVGKVNRMLKALNKEQEMIIKSYYMYETKWNYVSKNYIDIYNEPKTINQLKNIRDSALKIMLDVINI